MFHGLRLLLRLFYFVMACLLFAGIPARALQPFPLIANQQGIITCLENTNIKYEAYLPPAYATIFPPLPILYTMYPQGGGMVSTFKPVCQSLNIIVIGILNSSNGAPYDTVLRDFYAVTRDVRQRVVYDPTAEFAAGFSGGGENSYVFSRFRSPHVAGVFAMGGWLGRVNTGSDVYYFRTDAVQTNLLVARSTGTSDSGTQFYNPHDSNFLASCGAVVKDWSFSGGHQVPPDATKTAALTWLVTNRLRAAASDRLNAATQFTNWQDRIAGGESEAVLRECVSNLMNFPRSYLSYQSQLVLDQLVTNYDSFRQWNLANLAQGDWASDFFYYYARGAATNSDRQRYYGALKCMANVSGVAGDRAGDLYSQLQATGYPAPWLQCAPQNSGQLNLWINEDTPGLAYSVEARADVLNGSWQTNALPGLDTNAVWSASAPLDASNAFYRVSTMPVPGTSPSWPY